ncbi:MAG: DJ-1/PfpI family protein [Bacillota bacterium]|nr:DJ-1/PfpI family protein [Bacillota bacterium]
MKVYLFLTDGFEEIEAICVVDILRRAGIDAVTVSITGKKAVTGSHNIKIEADHLMEECDFKDGAMLVIPGGPGAGNFSEHSRFIDLLNKYSSEDKWIASICAAPTILGKIGLLKDKKAVCYPGMECDLKGAKVDMSSRVVVDGKFITSRGPGTTFDFALQIVERLAGNSAVKSLKEKMLIL